MQTHPPVIYVDVDDTLVRSAGSKRLPITTTVTLVRALHARGAQLYCWSRAGATYALATARELGLEACFIAFLPKPFVLLDDTPVGAWGLRELHPAECSGLTVDELFARLHADPPAASGSSRALATPRLLD